jgi:hypothetical protein
MAKNDVIRPLRLMRHECSWDYERSTAFRLAGWLKNVPWQKGGSNMILCAAVCRRHGATAEILIGKGISELKTKLKLN